MKLKKMLAAVLTMAMVATALPVTAFAAGEACEGETCEHVAAIGETHYADLREAMTNASGKTVELLRDVDLAGTEWEPVSFGGTFDGHNFAIKNLTINKPGVENVGFITSLNGAFENVTFTNPTVTGGECTGVLAGRAGGSASLAQNITVNGTIKVETTHSGYARAGVIVGGWAYGNYENITVDGGDKATSYIKHTGGGDGRYVAGIVGHADDVASYVNCTVKNITISGGWMCGGIAGPGIADGLASECVVENVDFGAGYSGGLFGWLYGYEGGAIEDCSVKDVTFIGSSTSNGPVGGYEYLDLMPVVSNVVFSNVKNSNDAALNRNNLDVKLGDGYYSLTGAIAAADSGDTITLLADTESSGVVIDKDITIDFGGNTYTVAGPAVGSEGTTTLGFQILQGNTVVLKNGTLTESAPENNDEDETDVAVKMLVQNYANLTVENMTLDGSDLGGDGRYVLSNNCGNIAIKDTVIKVSTNGVAFDVYKYASYPVPTVTVSGEKTVINGKFEVSPEATLAVSGGYFAQNPAKYVADGFVAVADGDGFKVITEAAAPAPSVPVEDTTATGKEEAEVTTEGATISGISDEQKVDLVNDLKEDLATGATVNVLVDVAEDITPGASVLQQAGVDTTSATPAQVVVKPYMDVEVQSVVNTEAKKEMKLDIEPKYDMYVTQEGNPEATGNKPVVEGAELKVPEGKPVEITVPLPVGFVADGATKAYVTHIKDDGTVHTYDATVDNGKATFTNPNGFSTFIITADPAVATSGVDAYTSLQAAVNAAGDGAVITMTGDVPNGTGVKVLSGKNITIDLGGHTYTVATGAVGDQTPPTLGFQLLKDSTITIKNGTITSKPVDESNVKMLIQNYANLTLENVTLDGSNMDNSGRYTLSNNNGNTTIKGSTEIIAAANGVAMDVYDYQSGGYTGAKVTFDTDFTGTVAGPIEISGTDATNMTVGLEIKGNGNFDFVPEVIVPGPEGTQPTFNGDVVGGAQISGGSFEQEVPNHMMAGGTNKITSADNSSEIVSDSATVTLGAGQKLENKEGATLLDVTSGSATRYADGSVSVGSGAVVNGTSFPFGGAIYANGSVRVTDPFRNSSKKGSDKKTEDTETPAETEKTLVLTIDQKIYQENGKYAVNDVAPIIRGERTFLPIRLVAEFLGATVTWNEAAQSVTITKDDTTIVIVIGAPYAMVNGESVELDAPAFIMNDRTYLPVRFISEALGADVTWDGVLKTVTIAG